MTDAKDLTQMLGGKWYRRYGAAPCPLCQPQREKGQNALTLADGRAGLLLDCKKSGCDFRDILAVAGVTPGSYTAPDPLKIAQREAEARAFAIKRAKQAEWLWKEAQPIGDTLAESYLRGRGITCPLPETLRFHPDCWHGATAKRYPALVALIEGGDGFSVHRTYLKADGTGKANIEPAKAMLGTVAGGAVRLSDAAGPLVVAEGIETALSLASGFCVALRESGRPSRHPGCAVCVCPLTPGRLTIAPDGDDAGRAAAQSLAEPATALGWQVSLLPAPDGRDWNDIIKMKGASEDV